MQKHSFSDISLTACNHCGTRANMLNWDTTFGSPLIGRSYQAETSVKYRYSFNGKEKDAETYGEENCIAFEARIYDSRLGRFLSTDPLEFSYPWQSTYCFAANNPIAFVDYLGMGPDPAPANKTQDPKIVQKGDGAKSFADRNHRTLDQIASANPTVFRNYPKDGTEDEKNNYWKTNEKQPDGKPKFMIYPEQVLAIGPSEGTKESNAKQNDKVTQPISTGSIKPLKLEQLEMLECGVGGGKSLLLKLFAKAFLKKTSSEIVESTAKVVTNALPKGKLANHLFKGADKLADTPANRSLIQEISNGKALGIDSYGKSWFAKTLPNGTQIYTYTQNGIVKGAGVNQTVVDIVARYGLK